MTVAAAAVTPNIIPPNTSLPLTSQQGVLTTTGLQMLQQIQQAIKGLTPTVSCNCSNVSNVYTLTPLNIAPNVSNYYSYWGFAFVASATSTGLITATIVPNTGTLPTLPVYKTNGSAQATTNDITINLFYLLYYVDSLNSGNGGFVIK